MEYNRTYWQARKGTKLNKFQKVNETTSTVELVNAPDAITVDGTEVTITRLNNMESGITGAVAGVNEIQGVVDFTEVFGGVVGLGQTSRAWTCCCKHLTHRYAAVNNGDIYKQNNSSGAFIALGQTSRAWHTIKSDGIDVYATAGSVLYKQTGGVGDFLAVYGIVASSICFDENYIYISSASSLYRYDKFFNNKQLLYTYSDFITRISTGGKYVFITTVQGIRVYNSESQRIEQSLSPLSITYDCAYFNNNVYSTDFIGGIVKHELTGEKTVYYDIEDAVCIESEETGLFFTTNNGDIYTATNLTGNTFRASSSFTLPAMPDGARKRILNTHPTTAITVTAYSGTTIEGQATMTLSAGHEVELELIGTDWRKTGWNEAALLTYSQPVDCSSRVAEYTGDGIPLIPDNVAGRTYFQDEWATTDGWTGSGATLTTSAGNLVMTATGSSASAVKSGTFGSANIIRVMIKTGRAAAIILTGNVNGTPNTVLFNQVNTKLGIYQIVEVYVPGALTALVVRVDGQTTGDLTYIDWVYIGTGAYDTPALDRAGNGNSLSLNAVTPVNGKYGKEMSFNGSTSYAQASSPVIGTTGTVAVYWKRNRIGVAETIMSNQSATTNGIRYHIDASNNLYAIIGGASPVSILIKSGWTDTASSHEFGIRFSATSATPFYDGVDGTTVSATQVLGLANFAIGRNQIDSTGYASGQGFVRYDSRIWTADEVRAWSLNPISIDSRV